MAALNKSARAAGWIALSVMPAAFSQTAPDESVIRTGTHVVLVNVVVRDKHGKPVAGLDRGDFVLRDNGQEQQISLFAVEEAGPAAPAAPPGAEGLTFTNRPPNLAAVTVFLFGIAAPPCSCWAIRSPCCTISPRI